MRRLAGRLTKKIGFPPGTTVHTGEHREEPVRVTLFQYDESHCSEKIVADVAALSISGNKRGVCWFNVNGVHNVQLLGQIERALDLHPLVIEDIANTTQRPKVDDYGDYLYLNMRMLSTEPDSFLIQSEQVSLVVGKHYLVSFQEKTGDGFEWVRDRLRQDKGRIRRMGSDYLMYSLLDAVVDQYFIILENLEEHINQLEDSVLTNPRIQTLEKIHQVRKEIIYLRRSAWPLREIASRLEHVESSLISRETKLFLRDVYDHIIQIIEITESFQGIVSSLLDFYLSSVSNKMNNVMKMLTLVATIFIPLTFLAGVYGMNFRYMPELGWRWAYPVLLGIMAVIAVSMVLYFKRKKWF